MYHNRRTIVKTKQEPENAMRSPINENGKLNKGFRYAGNGEVKDSEGNIYFIADYK